MVEKQLRSQVSLVYYKMIKIRNTVGLFLPPD